jgi:hypothetical protein
MAKNGDIKVTIREDVLKAIEDEAEERGITPAEVIQEILEGEYEPVLDDLDILDDDGDEDDDLLLPKRRNVDEAKPAAVKVEQTTVKVEPEKAKEEAKGEQKTEEKHAELQPILAANPRLLRSLSGLMRRRRRARR